MKILHTSFAIFFAFASIAIGEFDCELSLFSGREPAFSIVYAKDEFNADQYPKWEIIESPIGGYLGDIIIKDPSAVGALARIRCYDVFTEDLLPPQDSQSKISWFNEMGLLSPDARKRKMFYEHSWDINSVPFKVPIIIQQTSSNLGRCIFEIIDDNGNTLYSCVPAEVYKGSRYYNSHQTSAWIFNDDEESDRRMKNYARISQLETLSEIPADWTHFLNVKAIWIDENTDISAELMRRFILSGGLIFGKKEGIAPQLKKLGIEPKSILMGGIYPLEKKREDDSPSVDDPFSGSYPATSSGQRFQFRAYRYYYGDKKSDPMEDALHLFDRIKVPYLTFTFGVAGLYALASTVLLPFLFLRLKGPQRVVLWWKTPIAISCYTILVALVGYTVIYPKTTVSDATEYRLGYGDWPEVFCNVNTAALKFGGSPFGWKFPEATVRTYDDKTWEYISIQEQSDTSGSLIMNKATRGMQSLNGFAYMKKIKQPFNARLNDDKVEISTERDLRNICVRLANNKWIELGNLRKGESLTLPETFETVDIDFPDAIAANIRANHRSQIVLAKGEKEAEPCKNCNKVHTHSAKSLEIYAGSILLIAVDEHDKPAVTGIQDQQDHTGRVAWICQVPLKDYKPEQFTKISKTEE